MTLRRAVCDPAALDAILAGQPLDDAVAHYLTRVLRQDAGAEVELADGAGRVVRGRLVSQGAAWTLAEAAVEPVAATSAGPSIVLLAALLKANRWSTVVEKAAELGVDRLIPVLTVRGVVRPEGEAGLARWRRLALEAAKQCRRPRTTLVDAPVELARALAEVSASVRVVADWGGSAQWGELPDSCDSVALLVGPEGGFSEAERVVYQRHGFQPVSLGGYPLRAETACIALVTLARDRFGLIAGEGGA